MYVRIIIHPIRRMPKHNAILSNNKSLFSFSFFITQLANKIKEGNCAIVHDTDKLRIRPIVRKELFTIISLLKRNNCKKEMQQTHKKTINKFFKIGSISKISFIIFFFFLDFLANLKLPSTGYKTYFGEIG
jgi:hypothetical protein